MESSLCEQVVATQHSFEADLACFPNSDDIELVPHTLGQKPHSNSNPVSEVFNDDMNTTFARVQDQLDEDGIKLLFVQNQFEAGFSHVRRLFAERTNALHESAALRRKLLQLEASELVLKHQNRKLQAVVAQQNSIVKKLKSQRQELLAFYKKHKKYELREAQIENQRSLLEKVEKRYTQEADRAAEL